MIKRKNKTSKNTYSHSELQENIKKYNTHVIEIGEGEDEIRKIFLNSKNFSKFVKN